MAQTILGPQYGPAQPVSGNAEATAGTGSCSQPGNLLTNCGFETGDFTGWVTQDMNSPFYPLAVNGPTSIGYGFFQSSPTEGVLSSLNGFDGDGPGTIELGQDVTLPSGSGYELSFDYRGAWDMQNYGGSTQARTFEVVVEPSGGGAELFSTTILTAPAGSVTLDTGVQSQVVDLSQFEGQSVRVNFVWTVPEDFTGPGFFEVDNVSLQGTIPALPVPALDGIGLGLMVGLIAALAWKAITKVQG